MAWHRIACIFVYDWFIHESVLNELKHGIFKQLAPFEKQN